jgi:hypothetical protein
MPESPVKKITEEGKETKQSCAGQSIRKDIPEPE